MQDLYNIAYLSSVGMQDLENALLVVVTNTPKLFLLQQVQIVRIISFPLKKLLYIQFQLNKYL